MCNLYGIRRFPCSCRTWNYDKLFQGLPEKNDFNEFKNLEIILEKYMRQKGYRHTNSIKYRFKHNEIIRILNVMIFTIKHEGWNFLFRAIKSKIKRIIKWKRN